MMKTDDEKSRRAHGWSCVTRKITSWKTDKKKNKRNENEAFMNECWLHRVCLLSLPIRLCVLAHFDVSRCSFFVTLRLLLCSGLVSSQKCSNPTTCEHTCLLPTGIAALASLHITSARQRLIFYTLSTFPPQARALARHHHRHASPGV